MTDERVVVGRQVLDAVLPPSPERHQVAVLAQPGSARLARAVTRQIRRDDLRASVRIVPDGDEAKSLAVVEETYRWLLELGLTRSDTVVGVGGGALTDLAGFVAATYLRGIESVYVPTTLLGAVDAAIGGKTGVNLDGKNLIGAFWDPTRVVIDLDVLDELPVRLRRDGLIEALKAGLVADPELVELLSDRGADVVLDDVVPAAVAVKLKIVAEDPRDLGRRAVLNLGHTVGHAVEIAAALTHGEAVGVGLVAAAAASETQLGFPDKALVAHLVERLGAPTSADRVDGGRVRELLARDKKRVGEDLRMVLLRTVGDPVVQVVSPATVALALRAVGIS